MLEDVIRNFCVASGKTLCDLSKAVGVSRSTLYLWMRSPDWAEHPITQKINALSRGDLKKAVALGETRYDGTDIRQNAANRKQLKKHLPYSFGYALYEYLVRSKRSIRQLAKEVDEHPSHLVFVAKGQAVLHQPTYEALCRVDSCFIPHTPWVKRPYSSYHDGVLRQLVAQGLFTKEQIDDKWSSFKDGEYRTRFVLAYAADVK